MLREAVRDALKKLKLRVPKDMNEPVAQAERACDRWAAAEAKRRVARTLDADKLGKFPTDERCEFVRKRVKAYRDEVLSYEIGLERHRRNESREKLMAALALDKKLPEVGSVPVLSLNSDEWVWDRQELREAVCNAMKKLKLEVPKDMNEPAAEAARACDRWAAAEAKSRFGRTTDLDTPAAPT